MDIKHTSTGAVLFTVAGNSLAYANLMGASLREANLAYANLRGADLRGADLRGADLRGADLRGALMRGADLRGALMRGALMRGANLERACLPHFQLVPEEGAFIGWKKLQGGIIAKLEIPAEAKRTSSLIGRKNRAEFVKVLALTGARGRQLWASLCTITLRSIVSVKPSILIASMMIYGWNAPQASTSSSRRKQRRNTKPVSTSCP